MKSIPARPKKLKPVLLNLKITAEQMLEIKRLAKEWARGNVSAWVRFAAIRHRPRKSDLSD